MTIDTIRGMVPLIGTIRLGEKSQAGYPVNSQYFIFPKPGEPGHEYLTDRFNERTNVLDVHFPFDHISEAFSDKHRLYGRSGLRCHGDGKTATWYEIEERPDPKRRDKTLLIRKPVERDCAERGCPMGNPDEKGKVNCPPSLILYFCLSDVPGLGVWKLMTRSIHSLKRIKGALEMAMRQWGRISGARYQLFRFPIDVSPEGVMKTVQAVGLRLAPNSPIPVPLEGAAAGLWLPPSAAQEAPSGDEVDLEDPGYPFSPSQEEPGGALEDEEHHITHDPEDGGPPLSVAGEPPTGAMDLQDAVISDAEAKAIQRQEWIGELEGMIRDLATANRLPKGCGQLLARAVSKLIMEKFPGHVNTKTLDVDQLVQLGKIITNEPGEILARFKIVQERETKQAGASQATHN